MGRRQLNFMGVWPLNQLIGLFMLLRVTCYRHSIGLYFFFFFFFFFILFPSFFIDLAGQRYDKKQDTIIFGIISFYPTYNK